MSQPKFSMKIDLNVLNHLGINLYSNTPAVISEAIANSWDAGSENVTITINKEDNEMVIEDDGCGMTLEELNSKFLRVGYQKRANGELTSPKHNRKVMGRKGIGKLSLFSIANTIEVQSYKGGEKNGFAMYSPDIEAAIKNNEAYCPKELSATELTLTKDGTKITLKNIKNNINKTEDFLIKRIARRFSLLGPSNNFSIKVNNHLVTIQDRDYFKKLESIWYLGESSSHYYDYCSPETHREELESQIKETQYYLSGWIGTVAVSDKLKEGGESTNKISILVRGKVALEDILPELSQSGLYANYLIGEIHADFLDEDGDVDIATTSRQDFNRNDERYEILVKALKQYLKSVQQKWEDLRVKRGVNEATKIPVIKEWFETLSSDNRNKAKKLFGKINQITNDNPDQKRILFQQGVIAFEFYRHKDELSKLEDTTEGNVESLLKVFTSLDNLEASLYHKIVKQRVEVIRKLEEIIDNNDLEKTVQRFLFDHLWLLDPSWERVTGTAEIEKSFRSALEEANLSIEEKIGRVDIQYRITTGVHVIIELKRPDVGVSIHDLIKQVNKYRSALKKSKVVSNDNAAVKVVCVLGKNPPEFNEPEQKETALKTLEVNGVQILFYKNLITNAKNAYREYMTQQGELNRIQSILEQLDSTSFI